MRRRLLTLIKIFIGISAVAYCWIALTSVSAKDLPPLQNGDIIFQTSRSFQSSAIMLASLSTYSHMGIIEITADGTPFVVEAVGPVKSTALNEWIKRGFGGRTAIKRLTTLTAEQGQSLVQAAHKYDG